MQIKRIFKIVLLVVAISLAAWALLPYFFDSEVNESAPEQATVLTSPVTETDANETSEPSQLEAEDIAQETRERIGQFEGRNNYSAMGTVKLIEDESGTRFVRFNDDFDVDNGPDLIVYIGTANDRGTSLGALKGNIGAQNYEIPNEIDVDSIDTIRIFCRSFNVDFAITTL